MALQSDRLVMTSLSILGDVPPVALQPPLRDGIHLRWSFPRHIGFPWFGYYLFRRPHENRGRRCIASALGGRPTGRTGATSLALPDGTFASGSEIVLTDDFPSFGIPEVSVAEGNSLRFALPPGEMAFRIEVQVGLPWQAAQPSLAVSCLDGETTVTRTVLTGAPGDVVSGTLESDRITAVEFQGASVALVELCWWPVSAGAERDWSPLPDCPQPITLPLSHPDYPPLPAPVDIGAAEQRALQRIIYGPAAPWAGTRFAALHTQLEALVTGGPPGSPERAMSHPARAALDLAGTPLTPSSSVKEAPRMQSLHPLDVVLLGSIHAPIAQMVGLYWLDADPHPLSIYDYMIVADHVNVAGLNVEELLSIIQQDGFGQIDAWITFIKRLEPAPPLEAPGEVRAYALPVGSFRGPGGRDDPVQRADGAIGLDWRVDRTVQGRMLPTRPVMYHVWRDRQGNGQSPAPNAEAGELVTAGGALLVTDPVGIPSEATRRPADWPPFPLRCIDFALPEGWYGYQVNGIDLFGRFSPKSPFAEWRQWSPAPDPRPWYYGDPPDRVVHPGSVRILDKEPPPWTSVSAWVLDPSDPLLVRDQAHDAWRQALPEGDRERLVGLRVRWQWTREQQRQAPDTLEFRVYWHPG